MVPSKMHVVARAVAVVCAVALAALVVGCGDDESEEAAGDGQQAATSQPAKDVAYDGPEQGLPTEYPEPEAGGGFSIGWLNPAGSAETVATQARAVELEVKRLGGTVTVLDDQIDVDRQVSNMRQLLAQDVDAIGFFPLDPAATDPILKEARKQGVPVLAVNKTQEPDQEAGLVSTQVYQGSDHQAYSQVRYVAGKHPGGKITTIGIAAPVPAINYWEERVKYWAERFGLEFVANEDDRTGDIAGGENAMNALLTRYPEFDAVLGYNGPVSCAAGTAARASGRKDVTVVSLLGQSEGLECVRNGRADVDFQLDAVGMGTQAARALWALARDPEAELPPIVIRTVNPEPVTSENVDEFETWDTQLKEMASGG